jgi:hypothetical protein
MRSRCTARSERRFGSSRSWAIGRVGEWACGRVGEWASGRNDAKSAETALKKAQHRARQWSAAAAVGGLAAGSGALGGRLRNGDTCLSSEAARNAARGHPERSAVTRCSRRQPSAPPPAARRPAAEAADHCRQRRSALFAVPPNRPPPTRPLAHSPKKTSPAASATGPESSVRRGFCEAQSNYEVLTTNLPPSPALGA